MDHLLINRVDMVEICIQNNPVIIILVMLLLAQSLATLPRIAPATLPQIILGPCNQLDNTVHKSLKVIHMQ